MHSQKTKSIIIGEVQRASVIKYLTAADWFHRRYQPNSKLAPDHSNHESFSIRGDERIPLLRSTDLVSFNETFMARPPIIFCTIIIGGSLFLIAVATSPPLQTGTLSLFRRNTYIRRIRWWGVGIAINGSIGDAMPLDHKASISFFQQNDQLVAGNDVYLTDATIWFIEINGQESFFSFNIPHGHEWAAPVSMGRPAAT